MRAEKGSAELVQLPLVFYTIFVATLFPLLNIVTLLVAGTTQYLATDDFVAKAATQSTYTDALNNMASEAQKFQSFGLAKFVHLTPNAGYAGCGNDLYVLQTNIASGKVTSSKPNQPFVSTIDTTANMYELSVQSSYDVEPLISFAALPFLGNIPGLGKAVSLTFTVHRPVEHPGGLQTGSTNQGNATVQLFNRTSANPAVLAQANANSWRTPTIYEQIQNAGQTVVGQNVFIVQANNPNWTSSGLSVAPGQKIWVDTQAVGVWGPNGTMFQYSADGGPTSEWSGYYFNVPLLALNYPMAALLGSVGTNGTPFLVGNDQYNYPVSGSGNLSMIFNNYIGRYSGGGGAQKVRVIVVQ